MLFRSDIARRVADALASGDAPIHRLRAVLAAQLEVLGANPDAASCTSRSSVALVASRTSHRLWTPRSPSLYETSPRPVRPMARYDRATSNGQRQRSSGLSPRGAPTRSSSAMRSEERRVGEGGGRT